MVDGGILNSNVLFRRKQNENFQNDINSDGFYDPSEVLNFNDNGDNDDDDNTPQHVLVTKLKVDLTEQANDFDLKGWEELSTSAITANLILEPQKAIKNKKVKFFDGKKQQN